MTCTQARGLAAMAARGELGDRHGERLEAHLRDCAPCRQAAREEREFDRVLARSLSYTPMRVDLGPAVMRQIAARPRRPAWLSFLAAAAWGPVPRWVPASAGVAACLAAGIVAFSRPHGEVDAPQSRTALTVVDPNGARRVIAAGDPIRTGAAVGTKVRAPDGTVLTLDAQTRVVMEPNAVSLEAGRVFAAVRPQKKVFVVATDAAEVRVLGTEFAVERRPSGSTLVTVLQGAVRVQNGKGAQVVRAGTFTVARASLKPFAPQPIDAEAVLGWAGQKPGAEPPLDAAHLAARLDVTRRQLAAERAQLARVRKMLAQVAGPKTARRSEK